MLFPVSLCRSRRNRMAGLLLRFPTTLTLLVLLGFYALSAIGAIRVGAVAQLLIFPVAMAFYLVDPIGAGIARLGIPASGVIEVGLLVLGAVGFDWALRKATQ